ncbi:hypothetical protein, partial [Escherichia coli]
RNRSHWSTSKTPSYTKSVSWQHHPGKVKHNDISARIPLHKCAKKVEDVSRFVRLIETCLKMACHN